MFVDAAAGGHGSRCDGRGVDGSAFTLDEDVALGALAAEGTQDVSGVRRADIADSSNEVEAIGAVAALVAVDLVAAADGRVADVGVADSS